MAFSKIQRILELRSDILTGKTNKKILGQVIFFNLGKLFSIIFLNSIVIEGPF